MVDPVNQPNAGPLLKPVVRAERIPPELEVAAAARLMGDTGTRAGRRFVSAAATHGIDLSLMWGTIERDGSGRPRTVRQVCLAVPGAGRTVMMMLSGPDRAPAQDAQRAERVACLHAACSHLGEERIPPLCLAQALPDPADTWAVDALREAGFTWVGELSYLRRDLPGAPIAQEARLPRWPEDVTVRTVTAIGDSAHPGPDRAAVLEAMDRSYEGTLDCPELCGLRETEDVLESHRATGEWDPKLWWLVFLEGRPHGCMLLNLCPDQSSAELVYLGLSPRLRGRGLGARLLNMGLAHLEGSGATHVACAVDLRNAPALALYRRAGFASFARRVGLVRRL